MNPDQLAYKQHGRIPGAPPAQLRVQGTDADGDTVFSTFNTRDLDKSQPKMDCGTHFIKGGSGKYKGITGLEPFSCISKATPPGEPAGSFAFDIPHNTTWEIKASAAIGAGAGESGTGTEMKK